MIAWVFRRILQAVGVIIAMTVVVFLGLNVIGNPIDILIAPDATEADRERAVVALGLDKPLLEQYWKFVIDALHGDLGRSFVFNEPALKLIVARAPATLELAAAAMLMAVVVGAPLGFYAGLKPNSFLSRLIMAGSILGFSLPTFWVGLMLILLFSVQLGWLPSAGRGQTAELFGVQWSFMTWNGLSHLALPAINLALGNIALVMRLTRTGVRESLPMDYVKFARAKGLRQRRILLVHVMKNILIPIVTVVGLEFGSLIAFAVVTETIFSWPGMGKLIIDSINVLDRPVVVAYLMIIVLMFVVINLLVDFAYTALDPRVRLEGRE